jgi:thermopsin
MRNFQGLTGRYLLPSLVACVLILGMPAAAAFRSPIPSLQYNEIIGPGYYEYFQVAAPAASTTIAFQVSSNSTLSTAFMNNAQFNNWNNSDVESELSQSVYLYNGTSVQDTLHEPEGIYYLVFYVNDGAHTANVTYSVQTYPVDPYYVVPLPPPEPMGIAAYGINNASGSAVTYKVVTPEIVGIADISSMQAYNSSAGDSGNSVSGAGIQLNTILQVNESGGQQQDYWVQNTPTFVTTTAQLALADNIWNGSSSGSLSNSTLVSQDGGDVFGCGQDGGCYYSYEGSNSTYSTPLVLALLVNASVVKGTGVIVNFGAQVLQGEGTPASSVDWFDTVTVNDPTVQSADYVVSGNLTTANGLYFDTEMTVGGESNGESTSFNSLGAAFGLFYENAATGTFQSFPYVYSFGADTGETADNVQVSNLGDGFAQLATGTPNFVFLGSSSGTISFPLTASTITSAASQTNSASLTSSGSQTTTSSTGPSTSSTATASSISLPLSYISVVLVAFAVVAATLSQRPERRTRR